MKNETGPLGFILFGMFFSHAVNQVLIRREKTTVKMKGFDRDVA